MQRSGAQSLLRFRLRRGGFLEILKRTHIGIEKRLHFPEVFQALWVFGCADGLGDKRFELGLGLVDPLKRFRVRLVGVARRVPAHFADDGDDLRNTRGVSGNAVIPVHLVARPFERSDAVKGDQGEKS